MGSWMAYYQYWNGGFFLYPERHHKTDQHQGSLASAQPLHLCRHHQRASAGAIREPANGPITDPEIAVWLVQHPWLTSIFGGGFFLELFAFLALRNRPWALLIGLAIISFHRSVRWLMRLEFEMHEWLIWIFLVNVPFWFWWTLSGQWRRSTLSQ